MTRALIRSPAFLRDTKRLVKKQPQVAHSLRATLELLANDAFDAKLKTHKLKGDLAGSWACSVEYDLRIVLKFIQEEGKEAILLQSVGTHDEVY